MSGPSNTPDLHSYGGQTATDKLRCLIYGKHVELRQAHAIDPVRLVCDVYQGESNLVDLFHAYEN